MNRLDRRIHEVLERGEKYLCCVLPLGDPDMDTSEKLVGLFLDAGVDIVELMIPSRNPHFDSPQMSASCKRAFSQQNDLSAYLDLIKRIRSKYPQEPFEVMTYQDVVSELGVDNFVKGLKEADVEATLLADSIVASDTLLKQMDQKLDEASIYRIRFMPHPFRNDLLDDIARNGKGFMILQSLADSNGERPTVHEGNRELIERIRATGTEATVMLGYGIRDGERSKEAVNVDADGIIIGTVLMDMIGSRDYDGLTNIIREIKQPMRGK